MTQTVSLPLWLLVLILLFAAVTFASHFLFPSVRWFLRRRAERVVAQLNQRLARPIQPFKLARRTDMIQRLIYDPRVTEAVAEHARATGVREDVAFEQAKRYAREIVPGFSATLYFGVATRLARWLSTRLYHVQLDHFDARQIRDIDPDATVVFVINHRSNMDYVLVTYLVAEQSPLSYAVGEWARVWPLGSLIRSLGGYFIRRRSRNALYRRVLARYVQMASKGGVMQAVFPEGGLSQTGRLGQAKVGILSYILDEYDPALRDVVFVPIALNYDRVIEDTLLIEAQKKGEKRFRGTIPSGIAFTLRYVGRRITRRAKRFGNAGVSFGAPFSLKANPGLRSPEAVADVLMHRIATVIPVLPVPLVAHVLAKVDAPIARAELSARVHELCNTLRAAGAAMLLPGDDADAALAFALDQFLLRRIVTETADGFAVAPGKADLLSYCGGAISDILDATAETRPPISAQIESNAT